MHTFFVNTTEKLYDAKRVNDYLFCNLFKNNKLITFNTSIDKLNICATDISDLIEKDVDVNDGFNVIIYIDIISIGSKAEVEKKIHVLAVSENFTSILKYNGKPANNVVIIFGEFFNKNNDPSNEMQNTLWEMLSFPSEDEVYNMIDEIKNIAITDIKEIKLKIYEKFAESFSNLEDNSYIKRDSDLFKKKILEVFINIISQRIQWEIDINLPLHLWNVFENAYQNDINRYLINQINVIQTQLVESDTHGFNRRSYQIYLYVYYSAEFETILPDLPNVDWTAFAQAISKHKEILTKEQSNIKNIDESFANLDIFKIGGIAGEAYDKNDIVLIEDLKVPDFLTNDDMISSMKTEKLKYLEKSFFENIDNKNNNNENTQNKFISESTEKYNKNKRDALTIKLKESRMTDKTISSDEFVFKSIIKWRNQTESDIANYKDLKISNVDFKQKIETTKRKVESYFKYIKTTPIIWIIGVIVLLLSSIPYIWIQHNNLYVDIADIMILISIGIISVTFLSSYNYFIHKYKKKIIGELKKLQNEFNLITEERKTNTELYIKFLTHYLPRNFILDNYHDDFLDYREYKNNISQYKSYHMNKLNEFKDYIDDISDKLDIPQIRQITDDFYKSRFNNLNIKEDIYSITQIYSIVDSTDIKTILPETRND